MLEDSIRVLHGLIEGEDERQVDVIWNEKRLIEGESRALVEGNDCEDTDTLGGDEGL